MKTAHGCGGHTRQRRLVFAALGLTPVAWLIGGRLATANEAYPQTIRIVRTAYDREMTRHYHYAAYARKANEDGYRGVAYLFMAFAESELIHAMNFRRVLAGVGIEFPPATPPQVPVGTTRHHLLRAVADEIDDIDTFYPDAISRLRAEGREDAIASAQFALASEEQHRDKIRSIQKWMPSFFESVARTIDARTGQYFVCQTCGATTNDVPPERCPICRSLSTSYRKIDPPA